MNKSLKKREYLYWYRIWYVYVLPYYYITTMVLYGTVHIMIFKLASSNNNKLASDKQAHQNKHWRVTSDDDDETENRNTNWNNSSRIQENKQIE